jgi:hypothetical protein
MKKATANTDKKERAKRNRILDGKNWVDPMSGPMNVVKGL